MFNSSVSITLIGDVYYYNFVTSNGTYYVDNLNLDTYKTIFSTTLSGFNPLIYYITILGGDHYNVNAYLQTNLVPIIFNIKDSGSGFELPNANMVMYQNVNGTTTTAGSCISDFAGQCIFYLDQTVEYNFVLSKNGYVSQSGSVTPILTSYILNMVSSDNTINNNVFYEVLKSYSFSQFNNVGSFVWTVSSASGILEFFGARASYNGVVYVQNVTTSPNGGVVTLTIPGLDASVNDSVNVNVWFKASSFSLYNKSLTFSVESFNQSIWTILNGSFNNLSSVGGKGFQNNGQRNLQGLKAIIGMFIILVLIILFFGFSNGNTLVAMSGGLIGFIIDYKFQLLDPTSLLVSGILIVLSLIGYELWSSK